MTGKAKALETLLALVLLGVAAVGVKQCTARREREARRAEERALQALPGPPRSEPPAAPAPETTTPAADASATPARLSADAATPGQALSGGHLLGDPHARVRIVEYADYLCPHCRNMVPTVRALIAANMGHVAVVYRNYPIFGQRSYDVITAAECAARQGRFRQAFDALAGPAVLARPDWQRALARAARIPDQVAYTRCIADDEVHDLIQRDIADAQASGVTGTPAFVIGGRVYDGEQSLEQLQAAVQQALARAR